MIVTSGMCIEDRVRRPEVQQTGGAMSDFPKDLAQLEAQARETLDPAAWHYLARGAGDDVTLQANLEAWARLRLRPHVLRDVSALDTRTTVLGTEVAAPILVAPTAMHRFFCAEGEAATARAAASVGTVYVVSMAGTTALEDVAAAAPGAPRWAQMYMLADRGRTRALAGRARDAGYDAIVASVDGAAVPTGRRSTQQSLTPPDWFRFPNLAAPDGPDTADLMALVEDFDTSVTFDDLARFGEWSGLPVVVKGVLRGDDAAHCVDVGVAAVVVSNHGGRTLDGIVATAEALPDVLDGIAGRAEVYVDGGIRNGVDVAKAIALGARAVLVGRPVLWGLAVGGTDGAAHVLAVLADQFAKAMAFCGASMVDGLGRDLLR
jgi:4-hydroxymandelate oxidase